MSDEHKHEEFSAMMTTTELPMHELAASVALALGDGWIVDGVRNNERHAILRRPCDDRNFGISLYRDGREKRISISPEWPTAANGSEYPFRSSRPDVSIGVGINREPVAIAREIERRFLPEYRRVFAEGVKGRDEADAYLARQKANLQTFADLLGGSVRGEVVDVRMGDYDRHGYIHNLQVGGNTVQWDFRSMPVEIALKVFAYWKSL
jgi:hypothetical protein